MNERGPEFDIEQILDLHAYDTGGEAVFDYESENQDESKWVKSYVETPVYVLQDAVERLKRYEAIVHNLVNVGNYLWSQNLMKYGDRTIHPKETPAGSRGDKVYEGMAAFVNRLGEEITLDDAYVELALAMARIDSGDATGLSKYLEKEETLFEQLETGEQ